MWRRESTKKCWDGKQQHAETLTWKWFRIYINSFQFCYYFKQILYILIGICIYNISKLNVRELWKESLYSDGQQFHVPSINKTNNYLSTQLIEHKQNNNTTTNDAGNPIKILHIGSGDDSVQRSNAWNKHLQRLLISLTLSELNNWKGLNVELCL